MLWWWILAAAAVLAAIVFLDKIKAELLFSREHENDRIFADFRLLFGVIRIRYEVLVIDLLGLQQGIAVTTKRIGRNNNGTLPGKRKVINRDYLQNAFKKSKALNAQVAGLNKWLLRLLSRLRCESLAWRSEIGMSNAADTAVAVGFAWGLKSSVVGFLTTRIRLMASPVIAVTPNFAHAHFATKFQCVLHMRLFLLLAAGTLLLVRIVLAKMRPKNWRKI